MELIKVLEYNNAAKTVGNFDQKLTISCLRNHTVENIENYFNYHCYSSRIEPQINFGAYNNIVQESVSPESLKVLARKDIIVVSTTLHEFSNPGQPFIIDVTLIKNDLNLAVSSLLQNTTSVLVLNTFCLPFYNENGIANTISLKDDIRILNEFICAFAEKNPSRVFVVDFNTILMRLGEERAIDYRFSFSSKIHFKNDFLNEYAFEITKIGKAMKGKSKKVLVLDCDNTLWKGIIGEDGLNGIKLSKDSAPGNIYYQFQANALKLQERGVVLALCSKNNEEDVFEVLDKHPDCLIKKEHLAAWKINWDNKAQNIARLAEELNLGLDSFVFVDDNLMECNLIKEALPEVEVVHVPEKIYLFPPVLFAKGYFDTLTVSEEDKNRTKLYHEESQRKSTQSRFSDITEYLNSLNIEIDCRENDHGSVQRLAQLTQKTNQFNLTTRRYNEEDIKSYMNSADSRIFQFSVKDKFGDMGLTGLLIAVKKDNYAEIDSFLLSCRILGRNIEKAFINFCIEKLIKEFNVPRIKSAYIKSKKNAQTAEFWEGMGFTCTDKNENEKKYTLSASDFSPQPYNYIKINHNA